MVAKRVRKYIGTIEGIYSANEDLGVKLMIYIGQELFISNLKSLKREVVFGCAIYLFPDRPLGIGMYSQPPEDLIHSGCLYEIRNTVDL